MNEPKDVLERGLARFHELVRETPGLAAEFEASRAEFRLPARTQPDEDAAAARRHLEWFVLERPSDFAGGVPAEALFERWVEEATAAEADLGRTFLESLAGAFAVTSTEVDQGVWVQDLFGLGEYPIFEPEAATELVRGDLLVGRIFPVGDGLFRFSSAVSCFRNYELIAAVQRDLEAMRAGRRGVLRIQQVELEKLFFGDAPLGGAPPRPADPLNEDRRRIRGELADDGLDEHIIDGLFAALARAAENDDPGVVTELMNGLAFETDYDLERARAQLLELWNLEQRAARLPQPDEEESPSSLDARAALAAFDEGRRQGKDLEGLFQELAVGLGLGELEDEEPRGADDDLPSEIEGLIEEFLWDEGQRDPSTERHREPLRPFGEYTKGVRLFDELGELRLVDYAGRYLLEEAGLQEPHEAQAALEALAAFCRWAEEHHQEPLWSNLEPYWESLLRDVPRLTQARRREHELVPRPALHAVQAVEGDTVRLYEEGRTEVAALAQHQARVLEVGDLVRVAEARSGLVVLAGLPAVLRELRRDASEDDPED